MADGRRARTLTFLLRFSMNKPGHSQTTRESAFDVALAEYLRRVDAGENVDRAAFVAAHPEVANELREYFSTAEVLERVAGPTTDSDAHSTLSVDTARGF